jgi:hypothetical protein
LPHERSQVAAQIAGYGKLRESFLGLFLSALSQGF